MATAISSTNEFVDMSQLNVFALSYGYGSVTAQSATSIQIDYGGGFANLLTGSFTYAGSQLTGGDMTGLKEVYAGTLGFDVTGFSVPVTTFLNLLSTGDSMGLLTAIFGGDDQISGSAQPDYLIGMTGADTISGLDGADAIDGSAGNDSILGGGGADFVRGLEDNDTIDGGDGDDDVNGNMGADMVRGGAGADSVRGGQGNDGVYGDDGDDAHVNGNLGDDLVRGGNGNDSVFGGQGSDTLFGDDGDDWLSGDLGNDSLVGGAGADRFLFRVGSGVDVVGDFNAAQGDRVQLAAGTAFTLQPNGVISLGGGDQIVLVGVTTVQADWIVLV